MFPPVLLDQLLVSLPFVVVALFAERLQVRLVEEVFAHRPRDNVVNNRGRRHDPTLGAFSAAAELRPGPQRRTEFRPPGGVIQIIGPLSPPVLLARLHPIEPRSLHTFRLVHVNTHNRP